MAVPTVRTRPSLAVLNVAELTLFVLPLTVTANADVAGREEESSPWSKIRARVVAVSTCAVTSIGGGSASMLRAIMSSSLQVRPGLVQVSWPCEWLASANGNEAEPTLSVRSASAAALKGLALVSIPSAPAPRSIIPIV